MTDSPSPVVSYLRSTDAIRDRCGQLFDLACADRLTHFRCNLAQLQPTAMYVLAVMQANYPNGDIPFHSRWRHFQAGGIDRLGQLAQQWSGLSPLEEAKAKVDLVVTSVLLDAGAGPQWCFREPETGVVLGRSEGLAIASWHLFLQGGVSSDPDLPFQANAAGLQALTRDRFQVGFQISEVNPLVGVDGRIALMHRLGDVLNQQPHLFGTSNPRVGNVVDYLLTQVQDGKLEAHQVLEAVLAGLSEIWSDRQRIAGHNLGDVWHHSALPDTGLGSQLVPFHKLSQWLTYSLLEPLQDLGIDIIHLDRLTGLSEYRNGGLCVDLGLLQPKHEAVLRQAHTPDAEVIVEWRALTVIWLDRIAAEIRSLLGVSAQDLPLAKVLEGGTWAAGRQIAAERRSDGGPPLQIISDGTVF